MKLPSLSIPNTSSIYKYVKGHTLLVTIVSALIILIVVYMFMTNKKYARIFGLGKKEPMDNSANSDASNGGNVKNAVVLEFTANWCPYCKKAKPVWDNFVNKYSGQTVNGYTLSFLTIDCSNGDKSDPDTVALMNSLNITGFPTFLLLKGVNSTQTTVSGINKMDPTALKQARYDFDAKPEEHFLESFLNTVLQ